MKTDEMTINKYEYFWKEVFVMHIKTGDVHLAKSIADLALRAYKIRHREGEFKELTDED